jgi:hypothetical protein
MNESNHNLVKEINEEKKKFYRYTESEDFLGIILRGHLFIENELDKLLSNVLLNNTKMSLPFFKSKLDCAYSIGVIDKEWYGGFSKLNKIRNKYAHDLDYEFQKKDYEDLLATLDKESKREFNKDLDATITIRKIKRFFTSNEEPENLTLRDKTRVLLSNFWIYLKLQNLQIDKVIEEIHYERKINILDRKIEDYNSFV